MLRKKGAKEKRGQTLNREYLIDVSDHKFTIQGLTPIVKNFGYGVQGWALWSFFMRIIKKEFDK